MKTLTDSELDREIKETLVDLEYAKVSDKKVVCIALGRRLQDLFAEKSSRCKLFENSYKALNS